MNCSKIEIVKLAEALRQTIATTYIHGELGEETRLQIYKLCAVLAAMQGTHSASDCLLDVITCQSPGKTDILKDQTYE